jgi:hypothetical protein
MGLGQQVAWLFILALPVACIAWTVTHEEIFREWQEYCRERSQHCKSLLARKFFYPWQCEYCFSHYVTVALLVITRYKLLYDDWRGYVIAGFALVWVANQYMSLYAHIRLDIRKERVEIKQEEHHLEQIKRGAPRKAA